MILVWVLHLVGDPVAVLAEARRVVGPTVGSLAVQRPTQARADDVEADHRGDELGAPCRSPRPGACARAGRGRRPALVDRSLTPPRTYDESPADVIAKIERRTFSSLWDVDDSTWTAVVQPASTALRALPRRSGREPARSARRCWCSPPR